MGSPAGIILGMAGKALDMAIEADRERARQAQQQQLQMLLQAQGSEIIALREHIKGNPSGRTVAAASDSSKPSQAHVPGAKSSDDFSYEYASAQPVSIRIWSAIGIEPLNLGYWADCPRDWRHTARSEWTLDGLPIGSGINGQETLFDPGNHNLAMNITTIDSKSYCAAPRVRVLPRPPKTYYAASP